MANDSYFRYTETIDLCSRKGEVKNLHKLGGVNASHAFKLCERCLVVYVEHKGNNDVPMM